MRRRLGATLHADGCEFRVWAPDSKRVEVLCGAPVRAIEMAPEGQGYFHAHVEGCGADTPYRFRLDGDRELPDPASRSQASGVQGPSHVVDTNWGWQDVRWRGVPLWRYVLYELHVGTFTHEGTFDAIIPHLPRLKDLGVTAIEIMPVAAFPGTRNWGYDGVFPFAVQASYGGAKGLQRFVDACHDIGLAVVLDVVYNHLGPEGNVLAQYAPYFTDVYQTPWGKALNYDGPHSEEVRRYFVENALQWIEEFHIDALRLDAAHAIFDRSAHPFLEELAEVVHQRGVELGRHVYLIAESDQNDPRFVRPSHLGGHGLDAMWSDDFHHAAHALLVGDNQGYYSDFGSLDHLARAWRSGMSNAGRYSVFRQRRHGRLAPDLKPHHFVVCMQNHDQIGNRLLGERLSRLVGFEQQKLAAAMLCLSPFLPLLFMGEEYGETAPFLYFVDHEDPQLLNAIRKARHEECAELGAALEPPDPGARETFERCILDMEKAQQGQHQVLFQLHTRLLKLRRQLASRTLDETTCFEGARVLFVQRERHTWLGFCAASEPREVMAPLPSGTWHRVFCSADNEWQGGGHDLPEQITSRGEVQLVFPPWSCVVYTQLNLS